MLLLIQHVYSKTKQLALFDVTAEASASERPQRRRRPFQVELDADGNVLASQATPRFPFLNQRRSVSFKTFDDICKWYIWFLNSLLEHTARSIKLPAALLANHCNLIFRRAANPSLAASGAALKMLTNACNYRFTLTKLTDYAILMMLCFLRCRCKFDPLGTNIRVSRESRPSSP